MIKQEIYLEKYDWNVIVCHVANQEDVDEAMDLLSSIDCKGQHYWMHTTTFQPILQTKD